MRLSFDCCWELRAQSPASCLKPLSPAPGPHQHVVRLRSCQRNNPQPRWKRLFPELCFRPACRGLRREAFTSCPNEMELQGNHSGGRGLNFGFLRLPKLPNWDEETEAQGIRHFVARESVCVALDGVARCAGQWLEPAEKAGEPDQRGQAGSQAEIPRNIPCTGQVCEIPLRLGRILCKTAGLSHVIFDKCEWAENVLEIFQFCTISGGRRGHLTTDSVPPAVAPANQDQQLSPTSLPSSKAIHHLCHKKWGSHSASSRHVFPTAPPWPCSSRGRSSPQNALVAA